MIVLNVVLWLGRWFSPVTDRSRLMSTARNTCRAFLRRLARALNTKVRLCVTCGHVSAGELMYEASERCGVFATKEGGVDCDR